MRTGKCISDWLGLWARIAVVGFAAAAAGCGSGPVGRFPHGPTIGNQGGAWELTLGTPEAPIRDGWEYARLDDAMNIRGPESSEPDRLDDLRRFTLNPRADQIIYFHRRR